MQAPNFSLHPPFEFSLPQGGITALDHLGVIEVTGADNTVFLNGQLSNDLLQLSPTQARLAAFCSAKGRMQASFVAVRRANGDIVLVCSRDLVAATVKRLSMFVMRAKAVLRDASSDYCLFGLMGSSTCAMGAAPVSPWSATLVGHATVVQLYPANHLARQLWIAPTGSEPPAGAVLPLAAWHCSDVLSGVATLSAAVVDAFVPQMLNFESVGGVNFKKGCYPGQEVVARSQFRGTLKRRAYLVQLQPPAALSNAQARDIGLSAGQEVYSSQDADQPCGLVVQTALHASGVWLGIVSIQTTAAEQGELRLSSAHGPALSLLPLPYTLLEDV